MGCDTGSYFNNRVMKMLEEALRVKHKFAVANSPWSNGTCERMMREVVRALKALLQEERRDIREWMDMVPAVHGASGPVNSEHDLPREIRKHTVPHVRAGAVDKFLNLGFVDRKRLGSGCTRRRGFTKEDGERCRGAATTAQSG